MHRDRHKVAIPQMDLFPPSGSILLCQDRDTELCTFPQHPPYTYPFTLEPELTSQNSAVSTTGCFPSICWLLSL